MHKAANFLVSTTIIKEISNQAGYSDQLTFSKTFKNKFGMSPKSYRTYRDELETRKNRPSDISIKQRSVKQYEEYTK